LGKTIFIGDVHGCLDELLSLFNKLNYVPDKDRIIFLGDLVHKGPKSAEVIEFVFKNSYETIIGNHDYYFLKTLEGKSKPYAEYENIISSLTIPKEKIISWMNNFPCYIKEDTFLAVHAGIDPDGKCIEENNSDVCMNIRYWDSANNNFSSITEHQLKKSDGLIAWYEAKSEYFDQFNLMIYGHSAKKEIQFSKNHRIIGIDTGCCYGGMLTAYILEENKFVQIESQQHKQFDY